MNWNGSTRSPSCSLRTTIYSGRSKTMKILVTGGLGYIGSHTCVELLGAGFEVVVVDNLCNTQARMAGCIERIADARIHFHETDIRDRAGMEQVFAQHEIGAVIHFAGLKAVGESVEQPMRYYDNNITG